MDPVALGFIASASFVGYGRFAAQTEVAGAIPQLFGAFECVGASPRTTRGSESRRCIV